MQGRALIHRLVKHATPPQEDPGKVQIPPGFESISSKIKPKGITPAMTATSEPSADEIMPDIEAVSTPVRMLDGARMVSRGLGRLLGTSLILAALGLWLISVDGLGPEASLFRLAISLTLGFAGLGLWQAGGRRLAPEIEIDMIRREVRLVRIGGNQRVLLARCKFTELARAELEGHLVRIWDSAGNFLAEVELADPVTQRRLLSALKDAGKLA